MSKDEPIKQFIIDNKVWVLAEHHFNRVEELEAEVENLVWNLGGCSTYALGYGLDEGHSKESARPALDDVRRAMLEKKDLEAKLSKAREGLGVISSQKNMMNTNKENDLCQVAENTLKELGD